jgi:hypothetical protein
MSYPFNREALWQLFYHGPTYDGDLISKAARDELVRLGLAARCEGYNFLTVAGVAIALEAKMDRDKNKRQREERAERSRSAGY